MNLTIENNVWDEIPTNYGEEDWSFSNNGGNYAFGHRDVLLNGNKVGELQTTSSGISYCEITGSFTQTEVVEIRETGHRVCVDRSLYSDQYISAEKFISLLNYE